MAGLIDLDGLSSLASYSVRIQDLEPVKRLSADSNFVIAKRLPDQSGFENKNITYNTISSTTLEDFRTYDNVYGLSGIWEFNKRNFVFVDTYSAINNVGSTLSNNVAMNLEYLYNTLIPKIYELSAKIYGKNALVPSYVGQVITSSKLATVSQLKKVYGQNTEWEQICGKFICGVGDSRKEGNTITTYGENVGNYIIEKNNKSKKNYVPAITVRLNENEIPEHTHFFEAQQSELSLTWRLAYGIILYYNVIYNDTNIGKEDNDLNDKTDGWYQVKDGSMSLGSISFEGSIEKSTADFWPASSCKLTGEIYYTESNSCNDSPKGKLIREQEVHNNIPPFITKYVWKRKK